MMRLLRVLGLGVLGLLLLVLVAAAGIWFNAQRVLGQTFTNPVTPFTVEVTPGRVDRGVYLVTAYPGCAGCHAINPAAKPPVLDGTLVADLKPLGDFYAPNLTPGGSLKGWSDGEIVRAIREGVSKGGRGLVVMPSEDYRYLSDEDVQAIVAYLRSQPAVTNDLPPSKPGLLGTVLLGTGQIDLARQEPVGQVTSPPRGPTVDYGKHLTQVGGCVACHGPALDGLNVPPGPPNGGTLRVVKNWTAEQFQQTLRTGTNPAGHQLSDRMPWRQFGQGTDEDIRALYEYLHSLP